MNWSDTLLHFSLITVRKPFNVCWPVRVTARRRRLECLVSISEATSAFYLFIDSFRPFSFWSLRLSWFIAGKSWMLASYEISMPTPGIYLGSKRRKQCNYRQQTRTHKQTYICWHTHNEKSSFIFLHI